MQNTITAKTWDVRDLQFSSFVSIDTIGCDKEREKRGISLFGPCKCPCPSPCGCPVQRK